MAAQLRSLTILDALPKFSGFPREGDPPFVPNIDARTFLRSLENHYAQNNITDDETKIRIMYSRIDHTKGDALQILDCYTGMEVEAVTFRELKDEFLQMYPALKVTSFKEAASTYVATNLQKGKEVDSLTKMQKHSRAVVEAFLNCSLITQDEFNMKTNIATIVASENKRAGVPPAPIQQQIQEGPPPPQPAVADQVMDIQLSRILQTFAMHVLVASQLPPKVYDAVRNIGPRSNSTKFMSQTRDTLNGYNIAKGKKKPARREEVIWNLEENKTRRTPYQQEQEQANRRRNRTPRSSPRRQPRTGNKLECFNCKSTNHVRRDCTACTYCKKQGHRAKECRERLEKARGKYCRHCDLHDSHDTEECYTKGKSTRKNMVVRLHHEENEASNNESTEEWPQTEYESSSSSSEED